MSLELKREGDYVQPVSAVRGLRKVGLRDPLQSPDHVRLLKLHPPGWPGAPIADATTKDRDPMVRCEVYQIHLAELEPRAGQLPFYTALSYEWGRGRPCRVIKCNDSIEKIQLNLFNALTWTRHAHNSIFLWADRLCINQDDDVEKGIQVQRMHTIFQQAHVVHWLGEYSLVPEAASGLDAMRLLAEAVGLDEFFVFEGYRGMERLWERTGHSAASLYDLPWAIIFRLISLSYFSRLWMAQEIAFGQSHEARLGHARSHLDCLKVAMKVARVLGLQFLNPRNRFHTAFLGSEYALHDLYYARDFLVYKTPSKALNALSILAVLDKYRSKACTDPKDHIYAFLGLIGDGLTLRADYTITARQLFVHFSMDLIEAAGSLEVFSVGVRRTQWRTHSILGKSLAWCTLALPSWCPDWSAPYEGQRHLTLEDFKACGDTRPTVKAHDGFALSLIGVALATIRSCSTALGAKGRHDQLQHQKEIRSAEIIALTLDHLYPKTELWKVYLEVLLAGSVKYPEAHLKDLEDLEKLPTNVPVDNHWPMALRQLGFAWMYKYSKQMFHHSCAALSAGLMKTASRKAKNMAYLIWNSSFESRMFTTSTGLLGTGPEGLYVGDIVCVLHGGKVPYILRQIGNRGHYRFVGEAYVHGIMHGEALKGDYQEQEFVLI